MSGRSPARLAAVVRAHAKVNVALRVVSARSDGYHELQTVFQSLALHDTLRLAGTRGTFEMTCSDPNCPADSRNLVWRTARAVWRAAGRTGVPRGVAIHIEKRIPMQAGLGGGSSDAAAALRVLADWWRVPESRLPAIAASLGADVPYFLCGGTALGLERGDVIVPLPDAPRSWVLLVVPPFGVATADAYRWWDRHPVAAARVDRPGTNDLQPAVVRRHPEVARLLRAVRRAGADPAAMSGSGSTVFGFFTHERGARAGASRLASARCLTIVTKTIGRRGCLGRHFKTVRTSPSDR